MSPNDEPDPIDCDFLVVVDSREPPHTRYRFEGLTTDAKRGYRPLRVQTVCEKLDEGDYSIVDLTKEIAVERKEPNDFLAVVTRERDRFERELARMQLLTWTAVVVEASIDAVISGFYRSQVNPASVVGSWLSWTQRFPKTHWFFVPSREHAERLTFRLLERYWRDRLEGKRPTALDNAAVCR